MSFDVYLEHPPCEHCGRGESEVGHFNLTYNVNAIVDLCLVFGGATTGRGNSYQERSWGRLHGRAGADVLPIAEKALAHAMDPAQQEAFRALEPDNGWGDLESVQRSLRKLIDLCRENPKAIIEARG